jgi:ABC-type transport system substrate-binding protein
MTSAAAVSVAAAPVPAPSQDGERLLRSTLSQIPPSLNVQVLQIEHQLMRFVSSNLFMEVLCPELQLPIWVFDLAADYPVMECEDHYVWVYTMAPGFAFEDGEPINAHTVEFSLRMLNDPLLLNRNSNSSIKTLRPIRLARLSGTK